MTPNLGPYNFFIELQNKTLEIRNHLQVNVITQSTLSRVKVRFWNFQEDSGFR